MVAGIQGPDLTFHCNVIKHIESAFQILHVTVSVVSLYPMDRLQKSMFEVKAAFLMKH